MALSFSYHWRHLCARKTTTVLTVLVITVVVGALSWILGFGAALQHSMRVARDAHKVIVLRPGSTAESNSALTVPDYNKLTQLADLAQDPTTGMPLISPEMMVQISLPRIGGGRKGEANVAVRGVTPVAFQVHTNVKLVAGTLFGTGGQELIVGKRAAEQFGGLHIGETVNLGFADNRGYKVVGMFTADGGPLESEIWGYLPSLLNAYNRTMYSSAGLRVRADADPQRVLEQIRGPAITLDAKTESAYWNEQTHLVMLYMSIVGVLVGIMALAAVFAIANTMFAAVAGRTREIAMLRTIGFRRRQILSGFMLEAVLLALLGGGLGCLACEGWLQSVGHTKDVYGASTFTTMAFDIRLTPMVVMIALGVVTVVGALGAYMPARRAAALDVIAALREA
jgi:putative ABC transport system permease protein